MRCTMTFHPMMEGGMPLKRPLFSPQGYAFILVSLCTGLEPSFAQKTFERAYGDGGGSSVRQTSDGGYILAGRTHSSNDRKSDVYLIRTNSTGDTLWTRTYGGPSDDWGSSLQQTSDGGYIIAGSTSYAPYPDEANVYLVKTNSSGDTLWTRSYREENNAPSVQQTSDGGYVIAGAYGYNPQAGRSSAYLVKTNSMGERLWKKAYRAGRGDAIGYNEGKSVQQTSDGGYIIAGMSSQYSSLLTFNIYLVKTNPSGDTLWTKTYGGEYSDEGYSVQETSDGGYIVTGCANRSHGSTKADVYLLKTNASGDTLWTRTYGGADEDYGRSVQQVSDGGYIIAGWTRSFGAGDNDAYLLKTNTSGDLLWTRTYGGNRADQGYSVQQTSDGGYILAGSTASFSADSSNRVYLIKTDAHGLVASVQDDHDGLPAEYALHQNHPNPFNPSTTINYELPRSSDVRLTVYDVLGREVAVLVDERRETGVHAVTFDASALSSGVYVYRLEAGGAVLSKKLLLLK
jgi:hypothetical protein